MDAKKRLEMLKKQRDELLAKKAKDAQDIIARTVAAKQAEAVKVSAAESSREQKFKESSEIPLFSIRREGPKVALSVEVQVVSEELKPRAEFTNQGVSESSEDEDEGAKMMSKIDLAELREQQGVVAKSRLMDEIPDFKILPQEEVDSFASANPQFTQALLRFERQLNEELLDPSNKMDLIEDYIFSQTRDVQEQKGGFTIKKYEDIDFENKYVAFDVLYMKDSMAESENIAVVYNRAQPSRDHTDYAIGVYNLEKRVGLKNSRSEIKRIISDQDEEKLIYGGLDNGKVALWDLRTQRALSEVTTKVGEKSNYLPVIDLIKNGNFAFSLGLEGRLCKWDLRKFEEPILFHDIYSENDNITKLEAMTLGLIADPNDPDTLFVNTAEGSILEFLLTSTTVQQRSLFSGLHEAPIVRIQAFEVKNYFKEAATNKRFADSVTPQMKFMNYWASASFDWNIKIYRGTFGTEEAVIKYHKEFVTSLEANKVQNPFIMASADAEGKLAVWKIDRPNWDSPLFEWSNSSAIHKICWNANGTKLAVVDAKGGLNVIGFPKSKLAMNERSTQWYLKNGAKLNFKN